jgi:hypothetical protein
METITFLEAYDILSKENNSYHSLDNALRLVEMCGVTNL